MSYTFLVRGAFDLEYAFTPKDVIRAAPKGFKAFRPTQKAIAELEDGLKEALGYDHAIMGLRLYTSARLLIAIEDQNFGFVTEHTFMQNPKKKPRTKSIPMGYFFLTRGAFDLQYTFTPKDVVRASREGIKAFRPSQKAITELEDRLKEALEWDYAVTGVKISTNARLLIAIEETASEGYFNESWSAHLLDGSRRDPKAAARKIKSIRQFVRNGRPSCQASFR